MENKMKVGIIGCGDISEAYIKGCRAFAILEIAGCADLYHDKAVAKAAEFNLPRAYQVDDLLNDPSIELVINLTVPNVHAEVSAAILNHDKHVYSEKPLATSREDGAKIMALARDKGLRVGCAPDTFLGGGLQTCRKLIDDGYLGDVVGATAFMVSRGPESWHPNPGFFYQKGAGPLFDMGPYYLTALLNLIGPISRVCSATRISFPVRTATSPGRYGEKIPVEVPTMVAGLLDFAAGPVASLIMSFDIWFSSLPRIEIYGSEGTLSVPDPNQFDGAVLLRRAGEEQWTEMEHTHSDDVSRGIGTADMVQAIKSGRPHRASGDAAYHVLDIMQSLEESSAAGRHIEINSPCQKPRPLPVGLPEGQLDK